MMGMDSFVYDWKRSGPQGATGVRDTTSIIQCTTEMKGEIGIECPSEAQKVQVFTDRWLGHANNSAYELQKCASCNDRDALVPVMAGKKYCVVCWHNAAVCNQCGMFGPRILFDGHMCCTNMTMSCSHANKKFPLNYPRNCTECFKSNRAKINAQTTQTRDLFSCCVCGFVNDKKEFCDFEKHGLFRVCQQCAKSFILLKLKLHIGENHKLDSLLSIIWLYIEYDPSATREVSFLK